MTPQILLLISTACATLAAFLGGWFIVSGLSAPRKASDSSFEEERRARLRKGSSAYRTLEPLIAWLAQRRKDKHDAKLHQLSRDLLMAREPLPWLPEEYVAARQAESLVAGLAAVVFGVLFSDNWLVGLVLGCGAVYGYQQLTLAQPAARARKRMKRLKERLPYAVDLMALMMEAGAGFQDSLTVVVQESTGHPLGEEFEQVLRDTALGRPRAEVLRDLQTRLQDEDMSDLIFAIIKGEELGTPLSQILRNQAEQMRLKRSQWLEKESGESQVAIIFPGMVIMVACLLLILAPFIMGIFYRS